MRGRRRTVGVLAALVLFAVGAAGCGGGDSPTLPTAAPPLTIEGATTTTLADDSPVALPDPSAFTEEEITLGTEPYVLGGTVRTPTDVDAEPLPGVVVVHDFGPNDRDGTRLGLHPYRDLGEGLAERGVVTLTYDKRTNAHSDAFGGLDYTVEEEVVADAAAAVEALRARPGVDPDRVFVVGHGLGGMLAPRVADASAPAGLVLLDPPSRPLEEVTVDQFARVAELDGEITPEEAAQLDDVSAQAAAVAAPELSPSTPSTGLLGFPAVYWLDLRGYDPVAALAEVGLPTLVLWGDRAYEVQEADVARWEALASDDDLVELRRHPDLNHYFVEGTEPSSPEEYARAGVVSPTVVDEIAAFVSG